jgi:hypothetical protein
MTLFIVTSCFHRHFLKLPLWRDGSHFHGGSCYLLSALLLLLLLLLLWQ